MAHSSIDGYAIVTGAASEIGKETVFAFAKAGAKGVLLADVNSEGAYLNAQRSQELAIFKGFRAVICTVDVTDSQSVQKMVDLALEEFGRFDYCVNAAGVGMSDADIDQVLNVNINGAFLVSKAISNVMTGQNSRPSRGSIVNVASALAFGSAPKKTPYVTAKHKLLGITKAFALDLNQSGVRVNMVSPTWANMPTTNVSSEQTPHADYAVKPVAPDRAAQPEDVAAAILYLCGPTAANVTGSNLTIDGSPSTEPSFA